MRIAFFTDTFLHNPNGISSSLLLLRRELERRGHEVWVVAPSRPRGCCEGARVVRVVRVPSVPYPPLPAHRLACPLGTSLPAGIDVVHTHTPFGVGLAGAWLAHHRGLPHVSTVHVDYRRYRHYVPALASLDRRFGVVPGLLRVFYRRADLILAPSEAARRMAEGYGIGRPIETVPNGVDRAFLAGAPPVASPWPPGRRRLLAVNRLGKEKEVGVLLAALAPLAAAADVHLVVVGDGPERRSLARRAAAMGLADRVTLLPEVPFAAIGGYYRGAELLLAASSSETQGLVVWEAQAMGVPVVTVAAGGAAEGVVDGRTGYLVPAGDAAALAERALALLGDEERRRAFGARAEAWAGRETVGVMASRTLAAYGSAAALRRCRRRVGSGAVIPAPRT